MNYKHKVLLLLATLSISLGSFSQSLNLRLHNVTVSKAMTELKQRTGYSFVYEGADLNTKKKISVNAQSLDAAVRQILYGQDAVFEIQGKYIIIRHQIQESSTGPSNKESQQQKRSFIKASGIVVDKHGTPVVGATVMQKATKNGVVTNLDGQYTLYVPQGSSLEISYIGFKDAQVRAGINEKIVLTEDTKDLGEVVVVGYGTMRKSDVTGSISIAKGSDLLKQQNFSALDNLRGKVSGVNIFSNSDQVGIQSPRVVIRGVATINASSDPLYVVDGVVMNNFALVNPNDIESMEVLKDASSTAIYGARGANGVILVTTKRGLAGELGSRISYQGSITARHIARKMDLLNAQEWCDTFMKGLENENTYQGTNWSLDRSYWFNDRRYFDENGNPLYDTDWQDEATRTSFSQNHQINIQQSGKGYSVGAFLNYSDYQGIMLNTWNKRVSGKITYDASPTKWLSTSVNVMINHLWSRYTDYDGGGQEARRTMIEMLPWLPVHEPDTGNYTTSASPSEITDKFGFEGMSNPVMILNLEKRMYYNTQIFGNAAFVFHILPDLDVKTQYGVDWHNIEYRRYASTILNNISMPNGLASNSRYSNLYWQEETYLNYNKTFNVDNRLNAMLGLSWTGYNSDYNYGYTEGFSDDFYSYYNMGVGTNPSAPESNNDHWTMNSYFLRGAYTYKERYSMTVTGRFDGSSKFGKNNKYAFFPSAGLAWIVSNEKFMKNVKTISKLKLHTSYGVTGNSEIGTYKSLATTDAGTLLLNGGYSSYYKVKTMANPDLKWEKTSQLDFGFELGLFQNLLNFDVSYYYKKTSDLLLDCPVPHSTGFSTIYKNIGSVRNQGLDLMINAYPVRTNDFSWNSTLNLNFNKNKILKLGENNEDIELMSWVGGSESILRVGESMGSFYGYRRFGIWTVEDHQNGKCTLDQIGRAHRSDTKEILGKGIPDWTGSWINTLNYKNWDFTVDCQFVMGVQTMQQFFHPTYDRFGITNGLSNILYDSYDGTNPKTMEQMIYLANSGHAGQDTTVDSSWICNGSYFRLNMLQLGYSFSSETLKHLHLNALRLYVSANNVFLLCSSKFKGYDPESTSHGDQFGQNMTFYSYPRSKVFTFGINVTF